jgi:hypothetical protein
VYAAATSSLESAAAAPGCKQRTYTEKETKNTMAAGSHSRVVARLLMSGSLSILGFIPAGPFRFVWLQRLAIQIASSFQMAAGWRATRGDDVQKRSGACPAPAQD